MGPAPTFTPARILVCLSLVILAGLAFASDDSGSDLNGTLRLVDEDGDIVSDAAEFGQAVIYFEPDHAGAIELVDERARLTTRRRQFEPRVLVVQAGTEVIFPNDDPILHNVFSSSPENRFDLGLYGRSDGKTHRFDSPGLVRVFCNVHPAMSAHIVVVGSTHYSQPDRQGLFVLTDLPPGSGRLTVWHERAEPRQIELEIHSSDIDLGTIDLALTVRQIQPQRQRLRRSRRGRY